MLAKQRYDKNISQNEFSKRCGFSRQYVSLVESGKRLPPIDFLFYMAEGFDMSIEDFMMKFLDKVHFYQDM